MIGATVWNLSNGCVKVRIWDDDGERVTITIYATDLPKVINKQKVEEIWQDGEEMEFCFTPNCYELIRKGAPEALCPGCLNEYQQEQIDYRDMCNQIWYAGVIG